MFTGFSHTFGNLVSEIGRLLATDDWARAVLEDRRLRFNGFRQYPARPVDRRRSDRTPDNRIEGYF